MTTAGLRALSLASILSACAHPASPSPTVRPSVASSAPIPASTPAGGSPPMEPHPASTFPATSIFGRDALVPDGAATPGASPAVAGSSNLTGSLDKEIIRRIIRRHINEVKHCYEEELTSRPVLGGRILVRFTIGPSGQVTASELESSTMDNPSVEACTVAALRRWEFPKPLGGGNVVVTYPFVLTPGNPIPVAPAGHDAGAVEIAVVDSRIFVHRSVDAHAIRSNGLLAVTDRGLLLVDTATTEHQTEAILRWGEKQLARPWIGAVVTQDLPLHDGGLQALFRRHIPVAALDLTVAKLARRGILRVKTLFAARAEAIEDGRGFQAFYPGLGCTGDNLVVAFPHDAVLFGGCLLRSAEAKDLGPARVADLLSWQAAVQRVADRYPTWTIVPDEGAAGWGKSVYQHTWDLLSASQMARRSPSAAPPRGVGAFGATGAEATWSRLLREQVLAHWNPRPTIEAPRFASWLGPRPTTVLHMRIEKDGRARDVKVRVGSGIPTLDDAAVAAISAAQPLPAPPGELLDGTGVVAFDLGFRTYRTEDRLSPAEDEKHDSFAVIFAGPDVEPKGTLEPAQVYAAIESHRGEVDRCYAEQLAIDPQLKGSVKLGVVLGRSGELTAATVSESSGLNRALEACLIDAMHKWTFPSPRGGIVRVQVPFTFPAGTANGGTAGPRVPEAPRP
jgi:TonB family protein